MKQDIIEETIEVPAGIKISQSALTLIVEGPKGKIERKIDEIISDFTPRFAELDNDYERAMDRIESGDEIDQGIGGRVGGTVGEKLWHLGRAHQVFVITHLPQLAVFGDQHVQVQKVIEQNRTLTKVAKLTGEARTLELAQMLGAVSEGTLRSAHDILQSAQAFKTGKKTTAD